MSQYKPLSERARMREALEFYAYEDLTTLNSHVAKAALAEPAQKGQGDAPASLGPCSISESQHPTRSTDNASGKLPAEQRGALSEQDEELWDLLFPEGTHTEQLPVDWGRWLDAYTEENDTLLKKPLEAELTKLRQALDSVAFLLGPEKISEQPPITDPDKLVSSLSADLTRLRTCIQKLKELPREDVEQVILDHHGVGRHYKWKTPFVRADALDAILKECAL